MEFASTSTPDDLSQIGELGSSIPDGICDGAAEAAVAPLSVSEKEGFCSAAAEIALSKIA